MPGRRRAVSLLLLCLGACGLLSAAPAAAQGPEVPAAAAPTAVPRGTWAHAQKRAPVRRAPGAGSRRVATLHFLTEDKQAEVYSVLAKRVVNGKEWLRVTVPRRPRARIGWVPAGALGKLRDARKRLVINRSTLRATLYGADGRRLMQAPVGVGRPSLPTPKGRFYVREKLRAIGSSVYGPFAIGTSAYAAVSDWPGGGVVGIHGTDQPELVPGRPSHGCIRMRNADITRLWRSITVGTPIEIV